MAASQLKTTTSPTYSNQQILDIQSLGLVFCSHLGISGNRLIAIVQFERAKPRSHVDECPRIILQAAGLDVPHREHGNHNVLSNLGVVVGVIIVLAP